MTSRPIALTLIVLFLGPWLSMAMGPGYMEKLRQDTIRMFRHGFDNYMRHAFPEDELRPVTCAPLTRDRENPANIGLNDVLGNYSLTLIDSLSTLAILAGGPGDDGYTGEQALLDFQNGVSEIVKHYGDGRKGFSGQGLRSKGFDLDSKVQVFETVIRGVGGLLSAHLFANGDLPIPKYNPHHPAGWSNSNPLETPPIEWANGFVYDGQLLRLAFDLGQRLLPAFYTNTGIPYPRVNLRYGIPFYPNSPLNYQSPAARGVYGRDITETCSAGAGTLVLEFTVLSRLSGDPRFEEVAKRAFWAIWEQRSPLDLIGGGIDAERATWISTASGVGAGIDSFFEYAMKAHILLSGLDTPNETAISYSSRNDYKPQWLDPNAIQRPITPDEHSSDAFLKTWHQAHAAIKRHLYNSWQNPNEDFHHPSYMNGNYQTGAVAALWIDSLSAFYPGLLTLAGELEEAVEAHLLYAALWTRFRALPERWSLRDGQVESNLGWWPGRPEFIESTYHLYRATQDPWYLYVGEMVMKDVIERCYTECGWAGLQDVRTGEKSDRMESFFLGETTKYLYLLFDPDHILNRLDAPFVFSTEGHPLLIPREKRAKASSRRGKSSSAPKQAAYFDPEFTHECPVRPSSVPLTGSAVAARSDMYHAAGITGLSATPNIHGEVEQVGVKQTEDGPVPLIRPKSNYTYFPWTLPPTYIPINGSCHRLPEGRQLTLQFPRRGSTRSDSAFWPQPVLKLPGEGLFIASLDDLKLHMTLETDVVGGPPVWRIVTVNNVPLGREENAVIDADLISDMTDPLFKRIREQTAVELILSHDPFDLRQRRSRGPNSLVSAYHAAMRTVKDRVNLVFPRFQATKTPSAEGDDDDTDDIYDLGLGLDLDMVDLELSLETIDSFIAATPVGKGAQLVPDSPMAKYVSTTDPESEVHLPWTSVYLTDEACEPLPADAPRNHQVIVIRRGSCTFSEKLASIPNFYPSPTSLALVVVVDEEGVEEGLSSPNLEQMQFTPSGLPRYNPIPLVLVRTHRGGYEKFREATSIGIRRLYHVQSRGMRISNLRVR
ncbi:hypothetical protein jhhlp_000963 [Lomentospora prolificans]|uniref:alpha-1,2-Mannosidase n=1 Tax=Lomentospora prolificans TaxID=41688 RepID=A0A2N3NJZ1_9PEZI|nr:hypothetical protein jhhlp_000963 [Lomentospora prolificans]